MIQNVNYSEDVLAGRGGRLLTAANLLAGLASGGFAVAALADPAIALPAGGRITPETRFYARLYAVRSIALSSVLVARLLSRRRRGLEGLLLVAGLLQVTDGFVGAGRRNAGMVAGSALGAAVHLAGARWAGRGGHEHARG